MSKFESLSEIQAVLGNWQESVYTPDVLTPEARITRMFEEMDEVMDALPSCDNHKIAGELVDVVIVALGAIQSLGYNADNLIYEKIEVIFRKYNPVINQELRANGHSSQSAIDHQKQVWNNTPC